ncbi:MAG: transporter [Gammaproteobacteria bacterium]|nr:transporter [Gammaproteobacteria bacterium]
MSLAKRTDSPWRACLGAGVVAVLILPAAAGADPWIPAAGDGSIEPAVRQYDATSVFPTDQYGTATLPASDERYTMLRVTGTQGIGDRLSIEYDLRAGRIQKIRTKHGRRIVDSATGVEDQEVGLNLGLHQGSRFASSIALNVIAPTGAAGTNPPLGVGRTAIEPDLQFGFADRRWRATVDAGSRVFVDGAATQMRAIVDASYRLSQRVEIGASVFYVRTVMSAKPLPVVDAGEPYNVLRPGLRLKFRLTPHLKPYVEYEKDVSGQAIHAGRRITVGFTYDY